MGTYTVLASFAGSTDYTNGTASIRFTISKAAPSITVTDASGTYKNAAFTATTVSLEAVTPTLSYYSGTNASGTALSGAPTTAGTYTVLASFAGSTDYTSGTASTTFTVSRATPSVTATDNGGTYNGATFTASDTVAGVNEVAAISLEGVTLSLIYYSGTHATGTALSGAPTTAGTFTVLASFAGSTDYTSGSGSTTFTISKAAAPSVTVTDAAGVYNAAAFVATAKVGGAASVEGVTPSLTYFSGTSTSGTALSGAPKTSGTYSVFASFAGSTDYTSGTASTTFTISKATPSVSVTDSSGGHNNSAFVATDTVAGVSSQSTASASLEGVRPTLTYYSGSSATGMALSGAPSTVGTYTVLASFAGSTDYTSASASTTFAISAVTPPPVLAIGGSAAIYIRGKGAIAVVPAATLSTGDGAFANASLSVVDRSHITYPNDRLGIRSSGSLVVSGASLIYMGVTIGSFTGGGPSPLAITFNAIATQAAILAVVQNVTFTNLNPKGALANRTITFQLTDGQGNLGAAATQTVTVTTTPVLAFSGSAANYTRGKGAIAVVPAATLSTGDGAFANASLSVVDKSQITYPNDRLGIRSSGSLVVSGASLIYKGVAIGSFTGGGASPLAITFNANATQAAALAVVQNITFTNLNPKATLAHRTITIQFTDGFGNPSAAVTKTVVVI